MTKIQTENTDDIISKQKNVENQLSVQGHWKTVQLHNTGTI